MEYYSKRWYGYACCESAAIAASTAAIFSRASLSFFFSRATTFSGAFATNFSFDSFLRTDARNFWWYSRSAFNFFRLLLNVDVGTDGDAIFRRCCDEGCCRSRFLIHITNVRKVTHLLQDRVEITVVQSFYKQFEAVALRYLFLFTHSSDACNHLFQMIETVDDLLIEAA